MRFALGAVVLVSLLAGLGLLFRLSYVPAHVAVPVLVAISAIDGVLTLAATASSSTGVPGSRLPCRCARRTDLPASSWSGISTRSSRPRNLDPPPGRFSANRNERLGVK